MDGHLGRNRHVWETWIHRVERRAGRVALSTLLVLAVIAGGTAWNLLRSDGLARAAEAAARGDHPRTVQFGLDHLGRRPWSREAARLVARALSALDWANEAEPYYQRAGTLSLEDEHARAYGIVRSNQREKAILAYQDLLKKWPDNVAALRLMAGVYLTQRNDKEVLRIADQLIGLPNGASVGYSLRATVHHQANEREQAVAAFEKVLEVDPELKLTPLPRRLFWSDLAADLIKLGRPGDAAAYLKRAIQAAPEAGLLAALGQAYDQEGNTAAAEQAYRQALDLNPTDFVAHLHLGRHELLEKRLPDALSHFERAVEQAPNHLEALTHLALAYREVGRLDDAKRIQQRAEDVRSREATAANARTSVPRYAL